MTTRRIDGGDPSTSGGDSAQHLPMLIVVGARGAMGRAVIERATGKYTVTPVDRYDSTAGYAEVTDEHNASSTAGESAVTGAAKRKALYPDVASCNRPAVVVDFSTVEGFLEALTWCDTNGVAFVSGTTGLTSAEIARLDDASHRIPILHATNFSLGVAMLNKLVSLAASALPTWDAEVMEAHHRRKVDAPSGTAITLGKTIAAARHQTFEEVARYERTGMAGPRPEGEIGFTALRGGGIVGEHTVYLASGAERIELSHRASDRGIFADGALVAAQWIATQPPGRYKIGDILGDGL